SVISLAEILLVGQRLYTQNFLVFETMLAVAFYYVLIVTVFSRLLGYLERHLDVSRRTATQPAPASAAVPTSAAAAAPRPRATAEFALRLKGIQQRYGRHEVLKDIHLDVAPGQVVSIIGPSGSGKTSLIRTINGLAPLNAGEIELYGAPFIRAAGAHPPRVPNDRLLDIGMVFQSFNLFPHRTALQNVMMAP
ncbi:amino acid ABC transporter permease/ATP-binding protein, partial [Burkholderia multivorans]